MITNSVLVSAEINTNLKISDHETITVKMKIKENVINNAHKKSVKFLKYDRLIFINCVDQSPLNNTCFYNVDVNCMARCFQVNC